MTNPVDLCIYHANCPDGFASAWIVQRRYPNAEFIPAHYGDSIPEDLEDRNVLLVDFRYKAPQVVEISKVAASLTILDHHKTAIEDLRELYEAKVFDGILDSSKSGAMLTWEWFHPVDRCPDLIKYVQDRDLGAWKLPYSKEISAWIYSHPFQFQTWGYIENSLREKFYDVVDLGAAILCYQQKLIDIAVSQAAEMIIAGYVVPVTHSTCLFSEIAGTLAKDQPFAACYFLRGNIVQFSLRSTPDGVDVSEVAKSFGGGGHEHAAGFEIPLQTFTQWLPA